MYKLRRNITPPQCSVFYYYLSGTRNYVVAANDFADVFDGYCSAFRIFYRLYVSINRRVYVGILESEVAIFRAAINQSQVFAVT